MCVCVCEGRQFAYENMEGGRPNCCTVKEKMERIEFCGSVLLVLGGGQLRLKQREMYLLEKGEERERESGYFCLF